MDNPEAVWSLNEIADRSPLHLALASAEILVEDLGEILHERRNNALFGRKQR